MPLPIRLFRDKEITLQEQIYRFIRDKILDSSYPAGFSLPSTRDLAISLRVSRNTIMLAYEWLTSEGYIESRQGAGTFVCQVINDTVTSPQKDKIASPQNGKKSSSKHGRNAVFKAPIVIGRETRPLQFDFWYARTDPRQFPFKTWQRLIANRLGDAARNFTEYGVQGGEVELRQAISDHLALTRGFRAAPNRIVITCGAQEAFQIICRLFIKQGNEVVVENPCYEAICLLLESYGARLTPVHVDRDGLDPDALKSVKNSILLYTTPSHQFPTGAILPLARRQALLTWAEQTDTYIIEDDYDSAIIYDRPPLAALAALDQNNRVIYVGSFSKTIGSALRVGYLVLPIELTKTAVAIKSLSTYGQPWLDQVVVADFINSGGYRRHLRRIRTLFRLRRDALARILNDEFGGHVQISGLEGGTHLIWSLPEEMREVDRVIAAARTLGVGLYDLPSAGARIFKPQAPDNRLIMGYGSLSPDEIRTAIRRVAKALKGKR